MPASLKHPSSSSFAFCEAPLSALVNTRVGFLGHTGVQNWVCWAKLGSKLRLLGQSSVQTAFSQLMEKNERDFFEEIQFHFKQKIIEQMNIACILQSNRISIKLKFFI
jgi:hypothetical protein